jgi:hypothetical protein
MIFIFQIAKLTTMQTKTLNTMKSPFRTAGRAAIASGTIGIFAIASLIGYLMLRSSNMGASILMNRFHDVGVGIQFLLLIPVAVVLQKMSQRRVSCITLTSLTTGIIAICFVVLFLLLILPKIVSDILYMLPQGIFGVWLIFISLRMKGILSKGLSWFGMVVGLGLTLVGIFFAGYTIFVSTIPLRIPAASIEEASKIPITSANNFLHYFLDIGSLLGVLTLPFWTILISVKLFRERASPEKP